MKNLTNEKSSKDGKFSKPNDSSLDSLMTDAFIFSIDGSSFPTASYSFQDTLTVNISCSRNLHNNLSLSSISTNQSNNTLLSPYEANLINAIEDDDDDDDDLAAAEGIKNKLNAYKKQEEPIVTSINVDQASRESMEKKFSDEPKKSSMNNRKSSNEPIIMSYNNDEEPIEKKMSDSPPSNYYNQQPAAIINNDKKPPQNETKIKKEAPPIIKEKKTPPPKKVKEEKETVEKVEFSFMIYIPSHDVDEALLPFRRHKFLEKFLKNENSVTSWKNLRQKYPDAVSDRRIKSAEVCSGASIHLHKLRRSDINHCYNPMRKITIKAEDYNQIDRAINELEDRLPEIMKHAVFTQSFPIKGSRWNTKNQFITRFGRPPLLFMKRYLRTPCATRSYDNRYLFNRLVPPRVETTTNTNSSNLLINENNSNRNKNNLHQQLPNNNNNVDEKVNNVNKRNKNKHVKTNNNNYTKYNKNHNNQQLSPSINKLINGGTNKLKLKFPRNESSTELVRALCQEASLRNVLEQLTRCRIQRISLQNSGQGYEIRLTYDHIEAFHNFFLLLGLKQPK